ncbi:MAG: redoxin domain-containing protein [Gemmataceae bacterium]
MFTALTLFLASSVGLGEGNHKKLDAPAIGATIPNFTLQDIHRRDRSLTDYKKKKAVVVLFVGTECRLANLYVPTLTQMHKTYEKKGVQFLAINSNSQDTFVEMSAHAQERKVPFPVLKDFDNKVADLFGAKRTPEVFLIDDQRVIRYRGRIDDQYGITYARNKPRQEDLKAALEELLAGKQITTPRTKVSGCFIGRVETPRMKGHVTYTKHVAAILQKRCQECHRPGEIGPMSLLTYRDAKAWAETIHEVVLEQRMPPWHADPRFGEFHNDRRMLQEEIDTLLAWVDQGCPKGDVKDVPPPRTFPKGWGIGKPDVVFHMSKAYKVPATGVLPYKRFVVDPGFKKDMWVQAAECRPGNRAVVHHILVYIKKPFRPIYSADGTAYTLAGWAPGDMPTRYEPGVAKRIPAGAKLVFEMHYTPNGIAQMDKSSIGLIFSRKPPKHEALSNILANMWLRVPPNTPNHREEMTWTFPKDAMILSFMPHMHLRGTSAKYVATYPDGTKKTLLSVPDYDFNWQSVYRFKKPLEIPKGTKLKWICTWDNSADNPRNPDPSKTVRWGLQTWDEMQNGWMELVWKKAKK